MKYSAILLVAIALAGSLALSSPALPQPASTETVTVTGQKTGPVPRAVIDKILATRAAPTQMTGKIARWKNPICLETRGLDHDYGAILMQRIKAVATSVGTNVATSSRCTPNVTIVFTTTPQALLDDIEAHQPSLLGYHGSETETKRMATVSHPIQAWYTTETVDFHGHAQPDDPSYCNSRNPNGSNKPTPDWEAMILRSGGRGVMAGAPVYPQTCYYNTSGYTLDNGVSSDFTHVLVVADGSRITSHPFYAITDYIAMIVLSQTSAFEACDELPSIANLMSPSCDAHWKTDVLTDGDIAYLRGLYKMQAGGSLHAQQDDIAGEMERYLDGG